MTIKGVLTLILCRFVFICHGINFDCWDSSQQAKLTYANNANKTIDSLPSVRLFQGVYGSQWATQYTAYVYLTEKLGVNVTWYPSEEHYIFFDEDFDDSPGYPYYYVVWMVEDRVDLLMEIWPLALERAGYVSH